MPPSSRLGPYAIFDAIARRALTITYRAEHAMLQRKVLVKTLKPTLSVTSVFAQELEREARILGGLSHDSILDLYEFVKTPDAMWLVLEDPGGFFLSEVLAQAPRIDVDAAVAISAEIARGLSHAHERGVVHRGVRPENVLVVPAGGVKILDFGAAHAAWLPSAPEPLQGDAMFGLPDYMAPEQILGEVAGPSSDVFSLGVIAYEMLAGVRPFAPPAAAPGEARERERGLDVAKRIRTVAAPPLRGDVPRSVDRIVMRCLAKEPSDRYQDGRELCAAFEDALAARTHVPIRVLVTRALAAANLASELPAPSAAGRVPAKPQTISVARTARGLALVSVLVVGGAVAIELASRRDDETATTTSPEDPAAAARGRGYIRVLARPWAEILVDGEVVDTTPFARPIPIAPGRHFVTFRHPNAPEERRTVRVAAGQTVLLDVTMRIERPSPRDAGPPLDPSASP